MSELPGPNRFRQYNQIRTKAQTLLEILLERIRSGELKPGDRLPPEPEVARLFQVSRVTVRSALQELEKAGMIVRYRKRGTYISERLPRQNQANKTRKIAVLWGKDGVPRDEFLLNFRPEDGSTFRRQVAQGIQQFAKEQNYRLENKPIDRQDFVKLLEQLQRKRSWDGFILINYPLDNAETQALRDLDIPAVCFGPSAGDLRISYVDIDNRKGGAIAANHLLALGCKRILLVDHFEGRWHARDRLAGVKQAHAEQGLEYDEQLLIERGQYDAPEIQEHALRQVLERAPDCDGLIIHGDEFSVRSFQALQEAGIDIPGQLSVLLYDDFPEVNERLKPGPTVIKQPFEEMATEATAILSRHFAEGGQWSEAKIFQPTLVVRESCGMRPV